MKRFVIFILCNTLLYVMLYAQNKFILTSPDKKLQTTIECGQQLKYNIVYENHLLLDFSPISVTTDKGCIWGHGSRLLHHEMKAQKQIVPSPFYRSQEIEDYYNELILNFKGNYGIEFRAYNDGIAYRFVNHAQTSFNIISEQADFYFPLDGVVTVPYVRTGKDGDWDTQFFNSFENIYTTCNMSEMNKLRLAFLPIIVNIEKYKLCITESHLEDYPGLYLLNADGGTVLQSRFASYPKRIEADEAKQLQLIVKEREKYIAKIEKPRTFPWRIVIVATEDKALASNNLSYLLAAPSRLKDLDWIRPGKVAWEWWNDWNIGNVNFTTGVNNATYKAYIDFAASKNIEYVILDEGWAVKGKADLMQVVEEINLKELIDYATSQNVGIILWAGYHAFERDMENVCRHYAALGIKGFKVDFMDRDDQIITSFNYRAAAICAKYKLILNLHGTHKPAGLNRTYPNVLNFEGVHGLEQMKWSPITVDQVKYDVTVPFIRQVSGPIDYTQGAMRNATKENYYPCNSEPMSQGTRCRQLALYVIFDSPLNMLCDSPSNYLKEAESTNFIVDIPTVWDETLVLDGKLGEYIVTARRKGDVWYVGGITDWNKREQTIDLSFLPDNEYNLECFMDGVNSHRRGTDYRKEMKKLPSDKKMTFTMYPGGGFIMKITHKR